MLDFDTMLIHVGEFGRYQKLLFLFQAPFCIFLTFVAFGPIFMQTFPDQFYCADRFNCSELVYLTPGQKQNLSFPYTEGRVDACFITDLNISFLQEISLGQTKADKDLCRETTGSDSDNPAPQTCVHVYNGKFWYSELIDFAGYKNYKLMNRNYFQKLSRNLGVFKITKHNDNEYYYDAPNNANNYQNWGGGWISGSQTTENPGYFPYKEYPGNGQRPRNDQQFGRPGSDQQFGRPGNDQQFGRPGNDQQFGRPGSDQQFGRPGSDQQFRKPGSGQQLLIPVISQQFQRPQKEIQFEIPRINPPLGSAGNDNNIGGSEFEREFIGNSQQKGNNGFEREMDHRSRNICNQNYRTLRRIFIKNTTRLALENITMSNSGREDTPEKTYQRRGQDEEVCREIGWKRFIPGNSARYYPTIITEGNWWCNFERITVISQAIFFLGSIVGGVIFGWLADTWGRVPTLVLANLIGAIGGALSVISTDFWIYSSCRFITGLCFDNCFTMIYILVLEFCGPSYRTLVANLSVAIFYTLGTLILPLLALYLENWKTFGLAISLPMLLGLLAIFIVPESSRWLLSKGKIKQATNILRRFAKVNGKEVDESIFIEFEQGAQKLYDHFAKGEKDPSVTEAFKTPRLRKTFILLILIWSSIALVYDGHSRNILNLANAEWNLYWMFALGSMTEFPADILLILTLDRFGRRWLSFASMTLSGICSFVAATVPRDQWTATLVMAIMSRFWINMSFHIGLQYSSELLPTNIRAQGINIIHIMGYVASIASPFIAGIGRTQPVLSLLFLGAIACFGGILSLFLAETLGEDLPNTLEEAEAFGKHQSFWNCPICAKPKPAEEVRVIEAPDSVRLRNSLFRASVLGENRSSILVSSNQSGFSRFGDTSDINPTEVSKLQGRRRVNTR